MKDSQLKEVQNTTDLAEEKQVISGESLMVDVTELEPTPKSTLKGVKPIPPEIKKFLEAIPDTDMLKVDEMRKKYLRSFDMTEEQYHQVAEEILEEGFVLT